MQATSTTGPTSQAAKILFSAVSDVLAARNWPCWEADGAQSAWKLLSAPPPGFGCATVEVTGEKPADNFFGACPVEVTFAVKLSANRTPSPANLPRQAPALWEMADAVKAALLALVLPREIVPEDPAVSLCYGGTAPFSPPAANPELVDAVQQTWTAELLPFLPPAEEDAI